MSEGIETLRARASDIKWSAVLGAENHFMLEN